VTDPDDRDDLPAERRRDAAEPSRRRPTYNDLRDDYDDAFISTPASIACERLFVPAVAFLVIGVLGILGMFIGAVVAILDFLRSGQGDERLIILFILGWLICLGLFLFGLVVAGGVCMMRLRRYRLALVAAFVVTGLSIAGLYGILFYPFGIWALILLFRPDIRQEFRRPPAPVED
jgi:hypothetical protein